VVGASVNYSPEFLASEPNFNLLQRLASSGGGKLLETSVPALNPFSHDRQKTFQPRDLWERLLQFAIILFVFDVGVRRIQLDRDELRKAGQLIRRKLFFWEGVPQPQEAQESLNALLARRDQVRSTQTPAAEPKPELFQPVHQVNIPLPGSESTPAVASPEPAPPAAPAPAAGQKPVDSTTSRLLEAKRRAQKRNK
jgi:hypothetical protein